MSDIHVNPLTSTKNNNQANNGKNIIDFSLSIPFIGGLPLDLNDESQDSPPHAQIWKALALVYRSV